MPPSPALRPHLAPPDPATLPLPPAAEPEDGVRLLRAVPYAVRSGAGPSRSTCGSRPGRRPRRSR